MLWCCLLMEGLLTGKEESGIRGLANNIWWNLCIQGLTDNRVIAEAAASDFLHNESFGAMELDTYEANTDVPDSV